MFTDLSNAVIGAETITVTPTSADQTQAAALTVAHHAHDKDDLVLLLDVLGLPAGEDDLAQLLPHLNHDPDDRTGEPDVTVDLDTIDPTTRAVAVSMHRDDTPTADILTATGLTEDQLRALVDHQEQPGEHGQDASEPTANPEIDAPQDTGPAPAAPQADHAIEALLAWGEQHPARGVQALAARARTALDELAQRRETEQAVAAAESEVEQLKRQLAAAEAKLRQAKTGKTTSQAAPTAPAAPTAAPTALTPNKSERDRIRAWARANGYQVADRGIIAQRILDAYAARNTPSALPKAG